jgi:hypothetical protein
MPIFHSYIMTDWSGGNGRLRNRPNAIWVAYGEIKAEYPETTSPSSRTEATELISCLLWKAVGEKRRVLVCFDFAYGYPKGFATALQAADGLADVPWKDVWQYLGDCVEDDVGTPPHSHPTNRSNRFDVANQINSMISISPQAAGPFWCAASGAYLNIPQRRPRQPYETAQGNLVKSERLADERAESDTPFRLFGNGSVGSQSLTGIPRLHSLRNDDRFKTTSAVWPFETGWAAGDTWLRPETLIVHAEIYPSVREPEPDTIKDRGQVRAMWKWARELDQEDNLWPKFSLPMAIEAGSKADITIRSEEGWILGL